MFRTLIACGLTASLPFVVMAQEAAQTSRTVFTADDFKQFAPTTALDMVSQIPGFSIKEDDDGSRGFGQASGNVLINGKRISGKSNSPRDALGRIPADTVEKIELLDGTTLDIPGLSGQVVNVVSQANGVSGSWSYRQRFRENLPPAFFWFDASLSGKTGDVAWTLGIENEEFRGGSRGRENVFDNTGAITEIRRENGTFVGDNAALSASLEWTPENGHVANLNAEYGQFDGNEKFSSIANPTDGEPERRSLFRFSEDEWNAEIGGDYEFGLGPGRLKLIGLYRFEHSPLFNSFFDGAIDGSFATASLFQQDIDETESIARAEYSWSTGEGRDWQISLEGAENTLEAESVFGRTAGLPIDPSTLTPSMTDVEETRGEAFITHTRKLSPKWSTQISLGGEVSEIMASGSAKARSFTRPKGFVSATYTASEKLTVNAKVERVVGQLNFFDFVSSQNLSFGNSNTGNPDIVPEQSWLGELEFERSFGDGGAATLKLFAERIEDPIDRIPFGPDLEGPGNLDSAEKFGAELDATFKFAVGGVKGFQWEIEAQVLESSIEDPVTGEMRELSNEISRGIFTELRQDVPDTDWAWGLGFERFDFTPNYRLDEFVQFKPRPGFAYLYVEHKDLWGMTGSVTLGNLLDQDDEFKRTVFEPRRDGELAFIEDRSRNFGPILTVRLRGTF